MDENICVGMLGVKVNVDVLPGRKVLVLVPVTGINGWVAVNDEGAVLVVVPKLILIVAVWLIAKVLVVCRKGLELVGVGIRLTITPSLPSGGLVASGTGRCNSSTTCKTRSSNSSLSD